MTTIDISEVFAEDHRDDDYIRGLLQLYLEDEENLDVLLVALRSIAKARGGMSWLARETGMDRAGLYRSLSHGARPEFTTIQAVLKAFGLRLVPVPICKPKRGPADEQENHEESGEACQV